jgi:ornithine decarboxylase
MHKSLTSSFVFLQGLSVNKFSVLQQRKIINRFQKSSMTVQKPNFLQSSVLVSHSNEVVKKIKDYRKRLPYVKPYYAVKCNSEKFLLKTLSDYDHNYDCASEKEIERVLEVTQNIQSSTDFRNKIILSNPFKMTSDLISAKKHGILLTVADTQDELRKIKEFHPQARVLWRLSIKSDARIQMSDKFGANVETLQKDMEYAKSLEVNIAGIHFHRGSGGDGNLKNSFNQSVNTSLKAILLMKKMGFNANVLDVGGGFSGDGLGDEARFLHEISKKVIPCGIEMRSEPGRLLAAESMTLITTVIGKRITDTGINYHINDGIYHNFSCVPFDKVDLFKYGKQPYSVISGINTNTNSTIHSSTLFGFTCDGLDIIGKDYQLPELNIGDHIVFGGMGAYTKASATEFNGMPSGIVI